MHDDSYGKFGPRSSPSKPNHWQLPSGKYEQQSDGTFTLIDSPSSFLRMFKSYGWTISASNPQIIIPPNGMRPEITPYYMSGFGMLNTNEGIYNASTSVRYWGKTVNRTTNTEGIVNYPVVNAFVNSGAVTILGATIHGKDYHYAFSLRCLTQ